MAIDTSDMNARVIDAIENGQIQKFEIVTELLWKMVRQALLLNHAIETKSPKQAIKENNTMVMMVIGIKINQKAEIPFVLFTSST